MENEQKETSVIACKICKEMKERILVGKYGANKRWVDKNGKQFNGKVCPDCHRGVSKDVMVKIRKKIKEDEDKNEDT